MSDGEALLRAICDNPEDDLPRLAFADWLEENNHDERAEFIRVQWEFHNSRCMFADEGDSAYDGDCNNSNCRHGMLARRAAQLLHTTAISRELRQTPEWDWIGDGLRASCLAVYPNADCGLPDSDLLWWEFRKGFPEVVRCPLDLWLKVGSEIVGACPIRKVVASDKRPVDIPKIGQGDQWVARPGWIKGIITNGVDRWRLPVNIFLLLHDTEEGITKTASAAVYDTEQAAIDALGDVMLWVARDPGLLDPFPKNQPKNTAIEMMQSWAGK